MYAHLLVLFWPYATAALFLFPETFVGKAGNTLPNPTSTQLSQRLNVTAPHVDPTAFRQYEPMHCAQPASWRTPSFYGKDCEGALDLLFFETREDECYLDVCEFYGYGARAVTRTAQATPRKYIFGKAPSNDCGMLCHSFVRQTSCIHVDLL